MKWRCRKKIKAVFSRKVIVIRMCGILILSTLSSICTFLILKKTFDTVDHNILFQKLDNYEFHGVINRWFSILLARHNPENSNWFAYIHKNQHYMWCTIRVSPWPTTVSNLFQWYIQILWRTWFFFCLLTTQTLCWQKPKIIRGSCEPGTLQTVWLVDGK